jgi:diadenosine tetraphosphate (Ap4A) HIT family hydrolase
VAISCRGKRDTLLTMAEFDLSAHIERSTKGPCFVCAHLIGHPDYKHEPIYLDDAVVAFLSRYPTLRGYTIVAPRAHVVDVTGDRKLFRRVTEVMHDVAEALKCTLPTERIYLMSLGSHQGNAHVHWHVVPLPPNVPFEEQQFHAVMAENGVLEVTPEDQGEARGPNPICTAGSGVQVGVTAAEYFGVTLQQTAIGDLAGFSRLLLLQKQTAPARTARGTVIRATRAP